MLEFCTYFDMNYALRGLALFNSLKNYCTKPFRLHVACLDEASFTLLSSINIPELAPLRLKEIESLDKEFASCKHNRSLVEYYFTLSPVLPLCLLTSHPDIEALCYLDADLLFYSDPSQIFDEMGDASILITEHRFPPHLKEKEAYGRYNVQCQIFKNDRYGVECLQKWREECIEWCYDRLDGDRFADQKYLEKWPGMFKDKLRVSSLKGAGLAPWNCSNYRLDFSDMKQSVDGEPLIFHHFQGFKIIAPLLLNHGIGYYGHSMPRKELRWLYVGYYRELLRAKRYLSGLPSSNFQPSTSRSIRSRLSLWRKVSNLISKEWWSSIILTSEGII